MDYMVYDFRPEHPETPSIKIKEDLGFAKRIIPETTHYTAFTIHPVREDGNYSETETLRSEWYSLISQSSFKPTFANTKLVFFLEPDMEKHTCISNSFQKRLEHAISCRLQKADAEEREKQEGRILSSLAEFCRYIPDLDRPNANVFIDDRTGGVGITIKKSGTLSLLVHTAGAVDFSYASKGRFGGLIRITGTAKLTKNVQNSEHISTLIGFLEGK